MADLNQIAARTAILERDSFHKLFGVLIECSDIIKNIAPARRRPWLATVVMELYRKQNGLCAICSGQLSPDDLDVDHKVPFSYGGGNERGNLQVAHSSCNRSKQAEVDPHDLLRYLEDRYMNL